VLLENKNAIIYGGVGSIGGATARAFGREGATVHLAGRTQESLDKVAAASRSAGGAAEVAAVDALDELEATWHGRVERMSDLLAQDSEPERRHSTTTGTG
jgi:NAD(P)-dependent dehydrogenase (short-subunit alcohol dehydrogenase family)